MKLSGPLAKPRNYTDKDLYKMRIDGRMHNPPGHEHAHGVREWGMDHLKFGETDRESRSKFSKTQDKNMADKGALE